MAKNLDQSLLDILLKYGERPETALWDCHGTWVAYHKAIERIAAKAGIKYEKPDVLVAEREAAAILVTGALGAKTEWSIGEAVINLNYKVSGKQAAYPFAMAEKRAKDRVVLKLIGLHGLVYSEEESDDFKPDTSRQEPANVQTKSSSQLKKDGEWEKIKGELDADLVDCHSLVQLAALKDIYREKVRQNGWPSAWQFALSNEFGLAEEAIKKSEVLLAGE